MMFAKFIKRLHRDEGEVTLKTILIIGAIEFTRSIP